MAIKGEPRNDNYSVAARGEAGKARRTPVPRAAHADWQPQADRRDPIGILGQSNQERMPELVPIRYGRMSRSPFAFLRGSAAVMAYDLASTPVSGIRVQECGDCHLANFGLFATLERNDDPLLLQVKQANASVLEPYAGASPYDHHGERVVIGQRLMQSASDMFLGWTTGQDGTHYYVRQLRDMKYSVPLIDLEAGQLANYAALCGWALARAHAKAGDAAMISGYLGRSDAFDQALATFARAYADQTERAHAALLKAVQSGRVKAIVDY